MTAQVLDETSLVRPRGRFFGEPGALGYLAFTEAWERFSYYGMTALLVLYMSQALLLSPHVEQIAGFPQFRAAVEAVFGKMSTLALASQIMGLYTAFVYVTPVLGGWLADRFIGRRLAVVGGAVLMSAGHLAMAFDASFLVALALLIVGCGLLKGNISIQVGELYAANDGAGRTRGFAIFSTGINVGAVAGPLLCGLLAQVWGWHAGFGLAGLLMLFGLATYLLGYRHLPLERPRGPQAPQAPRTRLSRHDWTVVAALAAVAALTMFQSVAYNQNTNMNLVWIDRNVDMMLLGFHVPVSWFASLDSGVSIVAVPLLFALWRWQGSRAGGEPGDLGKIAAGAVIAAIANLLLVVGCLIGGRISILWPLAYDTLLGVAFLYYWPTTLALFSRAAPASIRATMMGAAFASNFIANLVVGRLGGFYETMSPAAFWSLHAAVAGAGAVLCVALKGPLERRLGTVKNV
jgi:POT family proton-dependent oligopeptide transporter